MDETERVNGGAIEPTPQPPREELPPETTAEAATGSTASAGAGAAGQPQKAEDQLEEKVRELAEKLKPVALAAEDAATTAVDLSAKGLGKLAAYLDRRRQERQGRDRGDGASGGAV